MVAKGNIDSFASPPRCDSGRMGIPTKWSAGSHGGISSPSNVIPDVSSPPVILSATETAQLETLLNLVSAHRSYCGSRLHLSPTRWPDAMNPQISITFPTSSHSDTLLITGRQAILSINNSQSLENALLDHYNCLPFSSHFGEDMWVKWGRRVGVFSVTRGRCIADSFLTPNKHVFSQRSGRERRQFRACALGYTCYTQQIVIVTRTCSVEAKQKLTPYKPGWIYFIFCMSPSLPPLYPSSHHVLRYSAHIHLHTPYKVKRTLTP